MHVVEAEKEAKSVENLGQLPLFGQLRFEDLELVRSMDRTVVFCRGFCVFTFERCDRFSRNYSIVQLHLAGGIKLKKLSELFGLNYQYCSKILVRFKALGADGLREETASRYFNRSLIDEVIGKVILEEKERGRSYQEISEKIRFLHKKKIKAESLRAWMYRRNQSESDVAVVEQMEMEVGQEIYRLEELGRTWHRNIYAGSMILYALIQRTGFLRVLEEYIEESFKGKQSSSGVRRVVLTLFFLHALRCKSIEQSKHIVGQDFCQIIGGSFLRLQSLRYAVDEIVGTSGFDQAIEAYFQDLIVLTDKGDRIYYTDAHFSSYYGKSAVPKGWDPHRQIGHKGRNTIYLHNSAGENVYLFESATNTTLSIDIEKLIDDLEKLGMNLKRKTLIFDRGGYSQKCFCYLKNKKKMYFMTYLKNRKKERYIAVDLFKIYEIEMEDGEKVEYQIYEGERRWTKFGSMRVIILLGTNGRQIPIITNNPYLRVTTIVYLLQRRWREENCFKYMIEHFGIDLLTSYKTENAPDKIIKRPNPERIALNKALAKKKNELAKLQMEMTIKISAKAGSTTVAEIFEQEKSLHLQIKNTQVDIDILACQREKVTPKIEVNLKDTNVIMAQKRRLFINSIKAMNYNCEKWMQLKLKKYHTKLDEVLSLIRSLWKQPGQIWEDGRLVEVRLEPLDNRQMQETLKLFLEELSQNNGLRMADGRLLRIKLTQ